MGMIDWPDDVIATSFTAHPQYAPEPSSRAISREMKRLKPQSGRWRSEELPCGCLPLYDFCDAHERRTHSRPWGYEMVRWDTLRAWLGRPADWPAGIHPGWVEEIATGPAAPYDRAVVLLRRQLIGRRGCRRVAEWAMHRAGLGALSPRLDLRPDAVPDPEEPALGVVRYVASRHASDATQVWAATVRAVAAYWCGSRQVHGRPVEEWPDFGWPAEADEETT